jgi:small subunit ribosomal protein S6
MGVEATPWGGSSLRFYETTIVLSPLSDETAVEREIEKITSTVARANGHLVATQRWGTKRMAYAIQKHAQGNYIHFVYQAPPEVPGELDAGFRINEQILRHLTVLVEGPLPTQATGTAQETAEAVTAPVPSAPAAAPDAAEEQI